MHNYIYIYVYKNIIVYKNIAINDNKILLINSKEFNNSNILIDYNNKDFSILNAINNILPDLFKSIFNKKEKEQEQEYSNIVITNDKKSLLSIFHIYYPDYFKRELIFDSFNNIIDFNYISDINLKHSILLSYVHLLNKYNQYKILNFIDDIYYFLEGLHYNIVSNNNDNVLTVNTDYNNIHTLIYCLIENNNLYNNNIIKYQDIFMISNNISPKIFKPVYKISNVFRPNCNFVNNFKQLKFYNICQHNFELESIDYKYSVLQLFNFLFNFNSSLTNTSVNMSTNDTEQYNKNKQYFQQIIFSGENFIENNNYPTIINSIIKYKRHLYQYELREIHLIDINKYCIPEIKNFKTQINNDISNDSSDIIFYIMKSPIFKLDYIVTNKNYFSTFYQLLETEFNTLLLKELFLIENSLNNILLYRNDEIIFYNQIQNTEEINTVLNTYKEILKKYKIDYNTYIIKNNNNI